jgi:hypothetical protein
LNKLLVLQPGDHVMLQIVDRSARRKHRLALAPVLIVMLLTSCATAERWFDHEASVPIVPAGGN